MLFPVDVFSSSQVCRIKLQLPQSKHETVNLIQHSVKMNPEAERSFADFYLTEEPTFFEEDPHENIVQMKITFKRTLCIEAINTFLPSLLLFLQAAEVLQHRDHSEPLGDVDDHHPADQCPQQAAHHLLHQVDRVLADLCSVSSVQSGSPHHCHPVDDGGGRKIWKEGVLKAGMLEGW